MGPGGVLMCAVDVIAGLLGASFDFPLHDGLCFSPPLPRMPDNCCRMSATVHLTLLGAGHVSALYIFSHRSGAQLSYMAKLLLGLAS